MLVLTRKYHQSIVIDNDIAVTVLSINDHSIKLGISAPKEIQIHREEVYQKIEGQLKNHFQMEVSHW